MAKKINRKVKMAAGGAMRMPRAEGPALQLIEQMRRAGGQGEEFDPVLASTREQRARPSRRPQMPAQTPAPLTAMQAPQTREEPLPLPPTPPAMRPDENPPPEAPPNPMRFDEGNPLVAHAVSMAQRYNLPPSIFLSLVQQESGFNPEARSRRGAIGLGQLMPATARELGVNPLDPEQNLEGSARYLRRMLDQFGDMELALAAYNAGPGRVRRAGNTIPNIRETQRYVPSILRRAGVQQGEFAEGGLADLDQKYAEGGRVRRTLRDELQDIEAEIRGERPASIGVTVARGIGEGGGGIAGVTRRVGRAARGPDEPPMIAMHNTRPERLERMAEREGVAVAPSIAITRADNPIDSFGDVSLMVSPQTVDPRRTPVYARDAYTPRYPNVETRNVRGEDREVIRVMNENTGEWRSLPHTPENALRVMRREPWRGGEDFITDNWLLAQLAPQFRNMSELRAARSRLVPATDTAVADWTKGLDDLRSEWSRVLSESGQPADWRFADSLQRNLAEAANRRDGMSYINRAYYNNAIPEDLLARTQAHLDAGRALPTTYFEAKPTRLVPLSEFEGAVVPSQAPQDLTDLLRRYGIEDIQYYASPEQRAEQVRRFERLLFGGAPVAAGAALAAEGAEPEPEGYAEGGRVRRTLRDELRDIEAEIRGERPQSLGVTVARGMGESGGGVAGIMAGRAARTADLEALTRAKDMRWAGADNDAIRNETGWFQRLFSGKGDPWRFEIPDTQARFTPAGEQMLAERNPQAVYNLFDVLDHPAYFEAYPERARLRVTVDPPEMGKTARGAYSNDDFGYMALRGGRDVENTRPTLLHELQHATQYSEGFPTGGSARTIWLGSDRPSALSEYRRIVERVATPMPFDDFARQAYGGDTGPDVERAYREYLASNAATLRDLQNMRGPLSHDLQVDAAKSAYLRLPGEIEARVVANRAGLDAENLRLRDPNLDYLAEWRNNPYAERGLTQLDQKYAEGGIVGAEAAKYDPDAVDALVKQIEAEYV